MTNTGLIVAWSLGYLVTAALLVRNSNGCFISRVEALISVTLPLSWPAIWMINAVYFYREWRSK